MIGGRHFVRILDKVGPGGARFKEGGRDRGTHSKSRLTFLLRNGRKSRALGDKIAALPWRELVPLVLGR